MSEKKSGDTKFDLVKLAELQLIERNILRQAAEINLLKKNEKLAKLEVKYRDISETYDLLVKDYNALEQSRKKIEDTIKLQSDRIKKIEEKLFSGTITSSKELVNYQDEIKQFKNSNDELESRELEIMFSIDERRPKIREFEGNIAAIEKEINEIKDEISIKTIELEKKVKSLQEKRKKVIMEIPRDVLLKYDEMKHKKGGIAVAIMKDSFCDICNMELPSGELERIKDLDKIHRCPMCGRMLIIHREEIESIKDSLEQ